MDVYNARVHSGQVRLVKSDVVVEDVNAVLMDVFVCSNHRQDHVTAQCSTGRHVSVNMSSQVT